MYALLALCLSLCPQVKLVDETVNSQLREKYGEKMLRMQRYDDEAFVIYDELFSYACPKFITPSAPSFEEPLVNYNQVRNIYFYPMEGGIESLFGAFCYTLSAFNLAEELFS